MATSVSGVGFFDIYTAPVAPVSDRRASEQDKLPNPNKNGQKFPPKTDSLIASDTIDLTASGEARLLQAQGETVSEDNPLR